MLACSMGHNAYAPTQDHKKTVRKGNATLVVQGTIASKCAEGLDISIFSTPMHIGQPSMIMTVETQLRIHTIKNGIMT